MHPCLRPFLQKFVMPFVMLAIFVIFPTAPAHAATAPATQAVESKAIMAALTKASAAVVGVKVTAVDGARAGQTLGANRSGSGVVIGADGVEVTTLEAFYKKPWGRESLEQPVKLTVREGNDVKTIDVTPQNRMLSLEKTRRYLI